MSRPCSDLYYIQLVYEYLLHMGMENSASQFIADCNARNYIIPDEPGGIKRRHISDLIQLFDEENELLFLKVFNSTIPQELQYTLECKMLIADLLVYFAALSILKEHEYNSSESFKPLVHLTPRMTQLYETKPLTSLSPTKRQSPTHTNCETLEEYHVGQVRKTCDARSCNCPSEILHPTANAGTPSSPWFPEWSDRKIPHPGMKKLFCFLEKECSNLRDHPHFTVYFSLAFTAHPQTHPRFKHLFQASWATNLRRKLWDFLVLHRQAAKVPDMVLLLPSNEVHPQKSYSPDCTPFVGVADRSKFVPKKSPSKHKGVSACMNISTSSTEPQPEHCAPEVLISQLSFGENHPEVVSHSDTALISDSGSFLKQKESELSFIVCEESQAFHSPESQAHSYLPNTHCHSFSYTPPRKSKSESVPPEQVAPMIKPAVQVMDSSTTFIFENHPNYENLKLRYHQLHCDYHNLIGVAAELTGALENSLRGQQIDLKQILKNCIQIFPDLFHQNRNVHSVGRAVNTSPENVDAPNIKDTSRFELDMNEVKLNLVEGSVKVRLLLLQALRWRITQSSREVREFSIRKYVENDLLYLYKNSVLESLLMPSNIQTPHPLQQAAARLINALASLKPGRDYLSQNSVLVDVVSLFLKEHSAFIDSTTKDMLVASLQKLSLRRSQRVLMIQAGMTEWLVQHLSSIRSHLPYTLEYSTALLMNLCLHLSAKQRCLPIAETIFTLLAELLSTSVVQALPYINGTIYSLVMHPELNKIAAHLKLATVLEDKILLQENPHIQKQLEHILLFHRNSLLSQSMNIVQANREGEMIDDDNEELDLLEEELDNNDPVRNITGELCGDTLLDTQYSISTPNQGGYPTEPSITSYPVPFVLTRPSTPLHHASTLSEDSEGVVVVAKTYKERLKGSQGSSRLPPVRAVKTEQYKMQSKPHQSYNSKRSTRTRRRAPATPEEKMPILVNSKSFLGDISTLTDDTKCEGYADSQQSRDLKFPTLPPELPEITIDYASAREKSSGGSDSEDVVTNTLPQCINESANFLENGQICAKEERDENGSISCDLPLNQSPDSAAFLSRPKIPRTPPH